MTAMRRNGGWAFVAWVPDSDKGRRQVWQSGFRTKRDAAAAERRFLVEVEDGLNDGGRAGSLDELMGHLHERGLIPANTAGTAGTLERFSFAGMDMILSVQDPTIADAQIRPLTQTS